MLTLRRAPALLPLLCLCLHLGGCGARRPSRPSATPPEPLLLIHPAAGDTVAGEIRLEAAVRTSVPPSHLIFSADEIPIDTLASPPWTAVWSSDAPPEGNWMLLGATAQSGAAEDGILAETIRSPLVRVWVLPDSAPKVTISLPSRTVCVERRPGLALGAEAWDPEDGRLGGERITWRGSRLVRELTGSSLPLDCLPDGRQEVTAEAADRWGRKGRRTVALCPFRYEPGTAPAECLENLRNGLQTLDVAVCLSQIDTAFVFIPCPAQAGDAGWDRIWPRDAFAACLRGWLESGMFSSVELEWTAGRPSNWTGGGMSWAWIDIRGVGLRWEVEAGTAKGVRLEDSVGGGAAVLLLRRPGAVWRVRQWRDFPPSQGEGLASVLARAGGMPSPRKGAVCGQQ